MKLLHVEECNKFVIFVYLHLTQLNTATVIVHRSILCHIVALRHYRRYSTDSRHLVTASDPSRRRHEHQQICILFQGMFSLTAIVKLVL